MSANGELCVTKHSVFIYDRGGRRRLHSLVRLQSVQWSRVRDDVSDATVVVSGQACADQADILSKIEPKRMEMVIYRGSERVWEGPITRVTWGSNYVEIYAKDIVEYLHARPLTKIWDNSSTVEWHGTDDPATPNVDERVMVPIDRTATVMERLEGIIKYELANSYERATMYGEVTRYDTFSSGGQPAEMTRTYRIVFRLEATDPVGSDFTWRYSLVVQNTEQSSGWSTTTPPVVGLSIAGQTIAVPAGPYLDFSGADFQRVIATGSVVGPATVTYAASVRDATGALGVAEVDGEAAASDPAEPIPGWEQLDPPANILPYLAVHHAEGDVRTAAKTEAFQMSVGEHLDNMARSNGADYTVVGRALHIWDTHRGLGRLHDLTEADFYGDVVVSAYGADHAEVAFVVAQITDADLLFQEDDATIRYGSAGQTSSYYGPWAKIFTVYDEEASATPTQAELNSQALRNLAGRSPVPVEVRVPDNSSIRLTDNLTVNHLVPGAIVNLRATMNTRKLSQLQKLNRVVVTETGVGEDVQVTFVPAASQDDAGVIA